VIKLFIIRLSVAPQLGRATVLIQRPVPWLY
jgi:hypothetical protein